MAWDFETEPEFQLHLDWIKTFIREEIRPLDMILGNPYDKADRKSQAIAAPLKEKVKERGLWACHLDEDLGGMGFGQLKLALMNELLGVSRWAPSIFGCQAPDSGNAEILAGFGTEEQKARFLKPLLDGEISSCYSMTEPHAGSDPKMFRTSAVRDGDDWVINGEKWFSSNARFASFFITMVVTNTDVSPYEGMSMFIIPADTPGVNIIRNVGTMGEAPGEGSHGYIRYSDVRVPADHLLGNEGSAFMIAQARLGGGRIHHAMRTVGQIQYAFDMMCERVLSRETQGELLANKQMVQEQIADSWIDVEQFRLFVLHAAWYIDRVKDYKKARKYISAIKAKMPKVYMDVVYRAMQIHGSLGMSNEMPFQSMWVGAPVMGIVDGPTEVHKITVAKQVLRDYEGTKGLFPTEHLVSRREAAMERFGHLLDAEVDNL